jgi:hypothetical protein
VWVADQVNGTLGVDTDSPEEIGEVTVAGSIDRLIADAGYVWILDTGAGVVTRLSVSSDRIVPAQASVGEGATDAAVGFGAVWVSRRRPDLSHRSIHTRGHTRFREGGWRRDRDSRGCHARVHLGRCRSPPGWRRVTVDPS